MGIPIFLFQRTPFILFLTSSVTLDYYIRWPSQHLNACLLFSPRVNPALPVASETLHAQPQLTLWLQVLLCFPLSSPSLSKWNALLGDFASAIHVIWDAFCPDFYQQFPSASLERHSMSSRLSMDTQPEVTCPPRCSTSEAHSSVYFLSALITTYHTRYFTYIFVRSGLSCCVLMRGTKQVLVKGELENRNHSAYFQQNGI